MKASQDKHCIDKVDGTSFYSELGNFERDGLFSYEEDELRGEEIIAKE